MKHTHRLLHAAGAPRKLALLAALALFCAPIAQGQTAEERRQIQAASSKTALDSLTTSLAARFAADEAAVAVYLAAHPEVTRQQVRNGSVFYLQRIGEEGQPVWINTKNVASGQMIGADKLYTNTGILGASVTGSGMVTGIWDGGQVRATHELLSGKVSMQSNQTLNTPSGNDHMTHVSGTMVGKLVANQPSARGIAYGATALNYDFDNDKTEAASFATAGYILSNHSYGYSNDNTIPVWQFGAYDAEAKTWDEITKAAPFYLPFIAAGNEQQSNGNSAKAGYDLITGACAAKNVMVVGGLNGDSTMSDYSNWGPTDDGRFKPEIVAKGTGINSSVATGDQAYSGNSAASSGTSYATPAAAATGLLLQQYYNRLTGAYMRSATLKALMMHTAYDLGNPGPDYKFGWGLVDAEKAARVIKGAKGAASDAGARITEYATNPVNNNFDEIATSVTASGDEPLIVSIAWLDDEGAEQTSADGTDPATGRLVYNFDVLVRITSPFADTRPWLPMGMANRTANAAKATNWFQDNGNNYRQVVIPNPVAGGGYNIYIRKSSSSPATVRPFTLIVSGTQVAAPSATATQNVCAGATVSSLTTSGGVDIQWYNVASGGTPLSPNTPLVSGTYYASQRGYTEGSLRTAVTVNVGATAAAPASGAVTHTRTMNAQALTFSSGCGLIATVAKSGDAPVNGSVTSKVYVQATAPSVGGEAYVRRHYDIAPASFPNTATATLTLYFNQSDFDNYNANNGFAPDLPANPTDATGISNLKITQYHGTSATGLPGSYTYNGTGPAIVQIDPADNNIVWNSTANRWEVTFSVTGFSGFFAHGATNSTPLSSEGVALSAKAEGASNRIDWSVVKPSAGSTYTVERSADGRAFTGIGTAQTSDREEYSLMDEAPLQPVSYYRVKTTSAGGMVSYSATASVRRDAPGAGLTASPVPVTTHLTIANNVVSRNGEAAIVLDMQGREMYRFTLQAVQVIDVQTWPAGVYTVRLPDAAVLRVVKQ